MKHVVLHTIPAWGHAKPLLSLMVLLAESAEDVVLTYLTSGLIHPLITQHLNKLARDRFVKIQARMNIIDISGSSIDIFNCPEFSPAVDALWRSGTLTCRTTNREFAALPKPTLAIMDPIAPYTTTEIRKVVPSRTELPIIGWLSFTLGETMFEWAPKELGGNGEIWEKANAQTDEDPTDVGFRLYSAADGLLLPSPPGYPHLYDYERFPQTSTVPPQIPVIGLNAGWKNHRAFDGVISVTSSLVEKEAIDAYRETWLGKERESWCLGWVGGSVDFQEGEREGETMEFLDKMQKEFGDKSAVYISFGTTFFPSDPAKLSVFISELITSRTPFILNSPSPAAVLPDELLAQIRESGFGYHTKWVSQEVVLAHPATGWFVTHGGWNSVQEAYKFRVPLYALPFILLLVA
ncbi:hypothetical protein V5O48_011704 [Marasmius crinis-equi]|uniref:Glycosyltransferase family 1 protein n=1 Tax=Marasmius crinis-equi TaxID=585013 RepID=A0ABR3F4X6_9AGAR